MTPYYQRDNITIYCGEASEVLSQLEPGSIDLTVTSPPYDNLRTYNGYVFDFEAIAGQLWRVTAPGGVVVWVVGDATVDGSETGTSFRQALGFMGLGFNLHDTMIYEKDNCSTYDPRNKRYKNMFEYMFIFSAGYPKSYNELKDKPTKAARIVKKATHWKPDGTKRFFRDFSIGDFQARSNIWMYIVGNGKVSTDKISDDHPAPFPEALARDHIISWSNPGDLVCDPMLGSGTTAKMVQQLGRRFVGCDISEDYCRIAVDRLRQPSFFSLPNREPVAQPEQVSLF